MTRTDSGLTTAPAPDEVEVSVFGPGRGEAIAVHIGSGKWITIDSCRNQRTKQHALLEYFETLGVDVATDVLLVVGTHAHDDHIAGIGELYREARSAKFVTSAAFTSPEFFAAVEADADVEQVVDGRVRREYRAVYGEADARGLSNGTPVIFAREHTPLLRQPAWESGPEVEIYSLSPSNVAELRARSNVALGAGRIDHRRRLAAGDPNEYSVALWIQIGDLAMLFGGDLLTGPEQCGWLAVCTTHTTETPASLFKVPHHGSSNAHLDAVWSDLLSNDVVSVLTPYRNGRRAVPKAADARRIADLSSAAYISANANSVPPSSSVKKARTMLGPLAQNVRELDGIPGHIRARHDRMAGRWDVVLGPPAQSLV